MSSLYLILALVFSLLIALFAIANTEPVAVNYVFGEASVSLIILILGSAFAGVLVMGLFSLFRGIKAAFAFRQIRQEKENLQKKVKALEEEKVFLEAELNKAVSVPEDSVEVETAATLENREAGKVNEEPDQTEEEDQQTEEEVDQNPHEPER
ncbi:MAG: LapA family protein [Bacillota bacterium]